MVCVKHLLRPEIPLGTHTEKDMNGISIVHGLTVFFVFFFSTRIKRNAKDHSLNPFCYTLIEMHMNPASFPSGALRSGSVFFWKSSSLSLRLCGSFSMSVSCE